MDMQLTLITIREVVRAYPECVLGEELNELFLKFEQSLSEELFNFFENIKGREGFSVSLAGKPPGQRRRKPLPIGQDNYADHLGEIIQVKVIFDSNTKVYKNFENFLSSRNRRIDEVGYFYIIEDDFLYFNDSDIELENNPDVVSVFENYLKLRNLFSAFKDLSDHVNMIGEHHINELIFFHKSKISLPVAYDAKYLKASSDCIDLFLAVIQDNIHYEQKKSIFKEALYLTLNKIDNNKDKLDYLITHFLRFYKKFRENYDLFVSEFSFDDVRKEYEEEKRKYLKEINDGMSNVQTKMLGIPLACAASAVKLIPSLNAETGLGSTLFIVFAILTYGLYLYFTIENERNSLESINEEYTSHFNRLKHHYADQYQKVEHLKIQLDERREYQDNCLVWFSIFSIVFCLGSIATIFYFHFTD